VLEYGDLSEVKDDYNIIIDAVGGETLQRCWSSIKDDGVLISVESASSDFVARHREQPFTKGKHNVRALFYSGILGKTTRRDCDGSKSWASQSFCRSENASSGSKSNI
jgi:NADPH:quinone reductase-like Zn-dependent oxidoreductase